MSEAVVFVDLPVSATVQVAAAETAEVDRIVHDAVTRRAYQLFEETGKIAGRDEENWRQAESEMLRNGLNVRETGSWISVDGELSSASSPVVQIWVAPRRVLVQQGAPTSFLVVDFPVEIDPGTAIACLKNGRLKLMTKKCRGTSRGT